MKGERYAPFYHIGGIMKKIIFTAIVSISLSMCFSCKCYATESTVNYGDGTSVTMTSDGQSGSSTQNQGSNTTNNSNSSTSRQYTQEERNAITYRNNIYSQTKGWYADLVNKRNNNFPYFSDGSSNNISNITIGSLNKSAVARLINNVNQLNNAGAPSWYYNTYNWGSSSKPSTSLEDDGSWNNLSPDEKERIREGILKQENSRFSIVQNGHNGQTFFFDLGPVAFHTHPYLGGQICASSYGTEIHSGRYIIRSSQYTNPGTIAVPNVYLGSPQIHFTNNYIDNFNGFAQMARNEGWKNSTDSNGVLQYDYNQNMLFGGSTASLNDNVYIALLTDYHVYSAQKDYISHIDYTSNQRRWTITLNGEPVGEPVITDNPRHELDFTPVYQEHGAGDYEVVAEQLAIVTRATYVKYDIGTYLFDAESGNLLYAEEKMVRNGSGKSLLLDEETSSEEEWMPTGDSFIVHVNDLGELSYNEDNNAATERTE